jgi:translation elongation factor EF-G
MRAIIYPANSESLSVEEAAPTVIPLLGRASQQQHQQLLYELSPSVLEAALNARRELIVHLANVDEIMEDSYLMAMMNQEDDDEETAGSCSIIETISTEEIQSSLRRMTLARRIMPTMCGAALRGLGVEPVLDCVAEYCKWSLLISFLLQCVFMHAD